MYYNPIFIFIGGEFMESGGWSSWQVYTFIFCVATALIIATTLTLGAAITIRINKRRKDKKDE